MLLRKKHLIVNSKNHGRGMYKAQEVCDTNDNEALLAPFAYETSDCNT